jgi:tetratricopeptide (TPR) repeat protein
MSPGPEGAEEAVPFLETFRSPEDERAFGLRLFEAEELLARGAADKALVLASRAVKERPDSLTARAIMDRARRELLRGRRREKLDARLKEAEAALVAGDRKAAEKVILSALKVVPDHPLAQELFKKLKEARQGTVEAEAEQELARLAQAEVKRAVEAARAAHGAGWEAKALLSIRRGLRVVPDAPELLGMLGETQRAAAALEEDRARRHALVAQVRAGQELLRGGQIGDSLKILRAVLEEDPDNARAQAAIQDVRRAWLTRSQAPREYAPAESAGGTPPRPLRGVLDVPDTVVLAREDPQSSPQRRPSAQAPTEGREIPTEIRLPRTLQHATPLSLVLGCGAVVALGLVFALGRSSPMPAPTAPAPPVETAIPEKAPSKSPDLGLLTGLDPGLREAVEQTLQTYAKALESHDAVLLAQARPDLSPDERSSFLAPFEGALDASTDLRVLDVSVRNDTADVETLRKDTIVGGKSPPGPPKEETLRFERKKGVWGLRVQRER